MATMLMNSSIIDCTAPDSPPLKLSLYNSTVATNESSNYYESHPFMTDVLGACGVDAIVSRIHAVSCTMELITYSPVHP